MNNPYPENPVKERPWWLLLLGLAILLGVFVVIAGQFTHLPSSRINIDRPVSTNTSG